MFVFVQMLFNWFLFQIWFDGSHCCTLLSDSTLNDLVFIQGHKYKRKPKLLWWLSHWVLIWKGWNLECCRNILILWTSVPFYISWLLFKENSVSEISSEKQATKNFTMAFTGMFVDRILPNKVWRCWSFHCTLQFCACLMDINLQSRFINFGNTTIWGLLSHKLFTTDTVVSASLMNTT